MAAITLYTHFVGNISLPNSAATSVEGAQLATFIPKYETQYLKTILGYDLWALFIAGLTAETGIYEAIRDGGTYEDIYTGVTEEWQGFATAGANPIANYIYYKIQGYRAQQTTGIGQVNTVAENATRVAPDRVMVAAWNEMVDFNNKLHGFMLANEADYPDYIGLNLSNVTRDFTNLFSPTNTFGI